MAFSRWTKARLQIVAVVAAIGVAVGIAISWLLSQIIGFTYDFAEFEQGARNGLTVAGALSALDLFYVQGSRGAWLRRLSFGRTVLLRACLFTAVIVAGFALNRLIFGLLYGFERSGLDYFGLPLFRDTVLAFVVFLVISEFLQMRRVIGGRTLNNLLLGRYHQPVREERVFMLVDIKGSTALAERLGDRQAHAFITSVFFDIDQPIVEHGGEVYNYVGDELIASWPLREGVDNARCVHCVLAIQDTLARRARSLPPHLWQRARGADRSACRPSSRWRVRGCQAGHRLSRRHPEHRRTDRGDGEGHAARLSDLGHASRPARSAAVACRRTARIDPASWPSAAGHPPRAPRHCRFAGGGRGVNARA